MNQTQYMSGGTCADVTDGCSLTHMNRQTDSPLTWGRRKASDIEAASSEEKGGDVGPHDSRASLP